MGHGSYSLEDRSTRAFSAGYHTKSAQEIFTSKQVNNAMNPNGITIRESRDSEDHPNTLAIILALDVTGSMGSIPHFLVKEGLPHIMGSIIQNGIKDPQLLFLAIGDHECDSAPLQVGQFESSDELLDKWLTTVYLEGGGGGNDGESYSLAHYFAAKHTSIDCFEKRKVKGFLFTIGDEPTLKSYPASVVKSIMGAVQSDNYTATDLLDKAKEMYNVFHLHIMQGSNGTRREVMDGWKQLMGDNLIIVERREDVAKVIAGIVSKSAPTVSEKQPFTPSVYRPEDEPPTVPIL
jgi:hypothetical protein